MQLRSVGPELGHIFLSTVRFYDRILPASEARPFATWNGLVFHAKALGKCVPVVCIELSFTHDNSAVPRGSRTIFVVDLFAALSADVANMDLAELQQQHVLLPNVESGYLVCRRSGFLLAVLLLRVSSLQSALQSCYQGWFHLWDGVYMRVAMRHIFALRCR